MSIPYSGLEDWPWRVLFDYNFNSTEGTKFDWYELEEEISVLKLCNIETSMTLYVKFDPDLIE